MEELLKKGDIIRLKEGMIIRTSIPEKVYEYSKPFSTNNIEANIEIGKIYRNTTATREFVANSIRNCLEGMGIKAEKDQIDIFIELIDIDYKMQELDTSKYIGLYMVEEAEYEPQRMSRYKYCATEKLDTSKTKQPIDDEKRPYKVICSKLTDSKIKVEFYQKAPFFYKNYIPNIEVVGGYTT